MALNAAAIDTRVKATVVSTMYDMTRVTANGYFDVMDENARYEMREELNAQRIIDFKQGDYARAGGVVDPFLKMLLNLSKTIMRIIKQTADIMSVL